MEIIYLGLALVQSLGISIGVGASTLAVLSYIVASKDGVVDDSERRLMKIVFTMLRIAMGLILVTLFGQGLIVAPTYGTAYFYPFLVFVWFVVIMLYANAILMTKRLMPRSIGPGLQAGSWYTLAFLYFLASLNLVNLTYTQLFSGYIAIVIVMIILINGTLAYFKTRV